jgi:hypothetical protein
LINLYRVTLLIKSYIVKGYRNKSALSRDLILTVITFASMAVLTLTTIYIGGILEMTVNLRYIIRIL